MSDDLELLRQLGGLHDAAIDEIVWRKADRSLRLSVEDMFSNHDGLPGYAGPAPGTVTFVGVENAIIETGLFRGLFLVSGIEVEPREGRLDVRLGLREPGADLRFRCRTVEISVAARKR